ncbi:MAG TPA: MDR family MFS transporter [Thermoanaerobaculia bacterium]|jgi:MFS family permease|nr:MDR family MFS transporter [Thermoanaerobaculia bacterium]
MTTAPRFDPQRRRMVTVALILVTALASFESTVVSTAMPTIIGDLGGLPLYSWVFSIYLLTSTVMMPVYGRLADIYGRRRILLVAISVFLTGAVTCGFAQSMPQLIAARALQGLGAAGLIPIALTVSGDLYSLSERAKIQGLFSGVWGIASLVGPLIGAWMTMSLGWRSIFTINIPLGLIALALVGTKMIESRSNLPDPLDLAGAASLAAGVTALLFAVLHRPGAGGMGLPLRLGLLALAAASLALFMRLQTRRAHPLIPPDLFRQMKTASPYLGGVLMGTTIYGVDTFVPLFVQGARGGTAGSAGAVVTPLVFLWAISAAIGARLVVRFGFRKTAQWGATLILTGLAALVAAAWLNASVPWISAACAVVGAGLGPSSISQVLAIQNVVSERQRGVATSLVPFFRTIGGSIGVGALGGLLAAGLSARLGGAAETAGRLLATGPDAAGTATVAPATFRLAIERSLLPVFGILVGLAVLNLLVTRYFPGRAVGLPEQKAEEILLSVD